MKTAIFSTHKFEQPYLLKAANDSHELIFISTSLNKQTAILAKGCQAVSIFVTDLADKAALEKLSTLGIRYITLRSAGYNNIDLESAKRLGLQVARVAAYSPSAIAEHAVALMLTLNRRLVQAYNQIQLFNFSLDGLVGFDMKTKTVGIIGTGKIGSQVARILYGFGCRIVAHDIIENQTLKYEIKVEYMSLPELYAQSDIITLHTPLTPQTNYLIRKDTIAQMKNGVMLINTGRGALLNTIDVIAALESGKIGYLGIDVYEHEEGLFFENHSQDILHDNTIIALMAIRNVIITGHQAFLTTNALENIAKTTIQNLDCFGTSTHSDNTLI
jgi:D-lactate dehydrogenase